MLENSTAEIFKPYKNIEFYLFGANGFNDAILDVKDDKLHPIDLNTMFNLD